MTDIRTAHLLLHAVDVDEAERIVAQTAGPDDAWAGDFPFEGDVGAAGMFLHASATLGEQRPFGYYRITRLSDGLAIGGIGFKGRPDDGCVEIGYGLAPSARGNGYAAEAVMALLDGGRGSRSPKGDRRYDAGQHRFAADLVPSRIPARAHGR